MIKKMLLLTCLFTSLNAIAVDTWKGYKPIEKVSAAYKATAIASVLQIVSVSISEKNFDNYEIVETESTKKVTNSKKLSDDSRTLQIETCRQQGLKRCPIFTARINGSGFVNNGKEFYTCRHMFHNWVHAASEANGIPAEQISAPMRIYDYNKNLVYNSATTSDLITVTAINPSSKLNFFIKPVLDANNPLDRLFMVSDFAALQSPVDLIAPKALSVLSSVQPNLQVYFSGFPSKTNIYGGTKKGDTPGNKLVSSTGVITTIYAPFQAFQADALATGGMSGGVAMDAGGNVIGVVCKSGDVTSPSSRVESTGALLNITAQENVWAFFEQNPI